MSTLQDLTNAQYYLHDVDRDTYKQGRFLAAKRRVVLRHDDDETASAEVYDEEDKYEVRLWAQGEELAASCTCSNDDSGSYCAHEIATALSL